jgi:hypothetical protein
MAAARLNAFYSVASSQLPAFSPPLKRLDRSPWSSLHAHAAGDWGELDEHDRHENELSLVHGFRLLSAYTLSNGTRIWIITEADRSATTLLLPSEY